MRMKTVSPLYMQLFREVVLEAVERIFEVCFDTSLSAFVFFVASLLKI